MARRETIDTNVLLLVVSNRNAQGLKPSVTASSLNNRGHFSGSDGHYHYEGTLSVVAGFCEDVSKIPVIDQTGLTNNFDVDFKWQPQKGESEWDGARRAIRDQLGLELVPTNMPIEMLVVEKAK